MLLNFLVDTCLNAQLPRLYGMPTEMKHTVQFIKKSLNAVLPLDFLWPHAMFIISNFFVYYLVVFKLIWTVLS